MGKKRLGKVRGAAIRLLLVALTVTAMNGCLFEDEEDYYGYYGGVACTSVPSDGCSNCSTIDACSDGSDAWYETDVGDFYCDYGDCNEAAEDALDACGCF